MFLLSGFFNRGRCSTLSGHLPLALLTCVELLALLALLTLLGLLALLALLAVEMSGDAEGIDEYL